MNKYRTNSTVLIRGGGLRLCLVLLAMLVSGESWSGPYQDFDFNSCKGPDSEIIFYVRNGTSSATPISDHCGSDCDIQIDATGAPSSVLWTFTDLAGFGNPACSDASPPTISCGGVNITIPDTSGGAIANTAKADLTGFNDADLPSVQNYFRLRVTDSADGGNLCEQRYVIRPHATYGGWGDPHITTVDGVRYDFQSAGEFISLRGNGIEVQTRQTAVSKQNVSGANPYTGIASCVSLYTAVALRVGPYRVTIQPNLSGVPDPEGLQLRVDGVLKTLGPDGIDLSSCNCPDKNIQHHGRIVRSWDEKSYEIHYANGSKVLVTPAWWANQQKWYLNVNVYDTSASEGIMGRVVDNWLPALPGGSSVGTKAGGIGDRYDQLYETFADSWRVTAANSLFDYAPGTSTATFTIDEWPRKDAGTRGCLLEGEPTAEPVDQAVAEEACEGVVDPDNRANCIFDVRETGHLGFADAYERSEHITPGATKTLLRADKSSSSPGESVSFIANVRRTVSTIGKLTSGGVQFVLDGGNVGEPVGFDSNGDAIWNTSSLQSGTHEIEARFIPSAFGERLVGSSSKISYGVCRFSSRDGKCTNLTGTWWFWLLIILLILLLLWFSKRFMASK